MARPSGQFDRERDRCMGILTQLAGLGYAYATTKYLCKRMSKSPKQVQRYIADLKKSGKIEVRTSKAQNRTDGHGLYKKRYIRPILNVTPEYLSVSNWMRRRAPQQNELVVEQPTEDRAYEEKLWAAEADRKISEALAREAAAEAARAAEYALYESMNPDKQFDETALLAEMQAELAELGIEMEIA